MTRRSCGRELLCSVIVFLLWVSEAQGLELLGEQYPSEGLEAVVSDVTPSSAVVLAAIGANIFKPGEKVELVYKAGLLPMILGVYEVSRVRGAELSLRPLTLISSPSKGMRVQVLPKRATSAQPKAPAPVKTHETNVYGHGDEPQRADLAFDGTAATAPPASVTGTVSEVRGLDIVVTLPQGSGVHVRPGQPVEAFLVLSTGRELSAGRWTVSSAQGDRATCSAAGEVRPRKGLKAVLTLAADPAPSSSADLDAAGRSLENFDRTGTLFDPNYKGVQ